MNIMNINEFIYYIVNTHQHIRSCPYIAECPCYHLGSYLLHDLGLGCHMTLTFLLFPCRSLLSRMSILTKLPRPHVLVQRKVYCAHIAGWWLEYPDSLPRHQLEQDCRTLALYSDVQCHMFLNKLSIVTKVPNHQQLQYGNCELQSSLTNTCLTQIILNQSTVPHWINGCRCHQSLKAQTTFLAAF